MFLFSSFAFADTPARKEISAGKAARMYEQYADMIYRIAYVRTLSTADSQDILQDVFCRYLRSAPEFTDEGHCRAWFIRTAINCSKNLLTSAWRKNIDPDAEPAEGVTDRIAQNSEVYHAVMQLPQSQRTVVHLYYYEDLPVADIARLTGLSDSAVKSRLFRAREALRQQLREDIDV